MRGQVMNKPTLKTKPVPLIAMFTLSFPMAFFILRCDYVLAAAVFALAWFLAGRAVEEERS